jgi:hypothetical protein
VNYANALFSKLTHTNIKNAQTEHFKASLKKWKNNLGQIKQLYKSNTQTIDTSSFNRYSRELKETLNAIDGKNLLVITNSQNFCTAVKSYSWLPDSTNLNKIVLCCQQSLDKIAKDHFDYVLCYFEEFTNEESCSIRKYLVGNRFVTGKQSTIYIEDINSNLTKLPESMATNVTLMPVTLDKKHSNASLNASLIYITQSAIHACFSAHNSDAIFLKYNFLKGSVLADITFPMHYTSRYANFFNSYSNYYTAYCKQPDYDSLVCAKGTRAKHIVPPSSSKDFIYQSLDEASFASIKRAHTELLDTTLGDNIFIGHEILVLQNENDLKK